MKTPPPPTAGMSYDPNLEPPQMLQANHNNDSDDNRNLTHESDNKMDANININANENTNTTVNGNNPNPNSNTTNNNTQSPMLTSTNWEKLMVLHQSNLLRSSTKESNWSDSNKSGPTINTTNTTHTHTSQPLTNNQTATATTVNTENTHKSNNLTNNNNSSNKDNKVSLLKNESNNNNNYNNNNNNSKIIQTQKKNENKKSEENTDDDNIVTTTTTTTTTAVATVKTVANNNNNSNESDNNKSNKKIVGDIKNSKNNNNNNNNSNNNNEFVDERLESMSSASQVLSYAAAMTYNNKQKYNMTNIPLISSSFKYNNKYGNSILLKYEDFDPHKDIQLHMRNFSWKDEGYTILGRYYETPIGIESLLDSVYTTSIMMTDASIGGQRADTQPFRSAIWHYSLRLYGINNDS